MDATGLLKMLIVLTLIGILVTAFAAILIGIIKGRGGLAVLSGFVALLGLLFAGGILFTFLAVRSPVPQVKQLVFDNSDHYPIDGNHWPLNSVPFDEVSNTWSDGPGNVRTTWDISLTPLLFLIC